jgi:phage tail-like protein
MSTRSYLLGLRAGWRAAASTGLAVDRRLHTQASGSYRSQRLDGRLPGCAWDTLRCRLHLGAGHSFSVATHTSDVDRGDAGVAALPDSEWSAAVDLAGPYDGKWDALISSPEGRYLWLRLQLTGSPGQEASIEWISIGYPRNTSLRLLPALYSTREGGRDLNERLLAAFDAMRDGVLAEIRALGRVIDPRTTDASSSRDFLTWLATWLDVDALRSWPEARRRAVIAHAGDLFRLRGTPRGIALFIELATGHRVTIVEDHRWRGWWFAARGLLGCSVLFGAALLPRTRLDGDSIVGQAIVNSVPSPYLDPFSAKASAFCVLIPPSVSPSELATIRRIVEAEKPAHTRFEMCPVRADMRLGVSSQLGLDSVFGQLAPPAILPTREPRVRVGVTAML